MTAQTKGALGATPASFASVLPPSDCRLAILSGLCDNPPEETVEIYGTAGTILYNFTRDTILAATRGQSCLTEVPLGAQRREWTVERDFIDAIHTGDRNRIEPTFEQGVKYMEFLEAVWLSSDKGQKVRLPLEDAAPQR